MNSYISLFYLGGFLPLAILIYMLVPKKYRWYSLLIMSISLYWIMCYKLIAFITITVLTTYLIAKKIQKYNDEINENHKLKSSIQKKQKRWIFLQVLINLGMLVVLKYSKFILLNFNHLFNFFDLGWHLPIPKFLLPIGISFYTLQAISYLIDVYRQTNKAENNILKLTLYLCFFPTIIEGPICRYHDLSLTLFNGDSIKYNNFRNGLLRIGYGVMKKIVIADRLNLFVKRMFTDYATMHGELLFLGALFYTIQLYMEFSGTMDIVIGSGEIFGIKITENFNHPFFSKSIQEFWMRWHITLGAWLKDYIFYPISLSKPIKNLRKSLKNKLSRKVIGLVTNSIALFAVWVLNGLWHGSGWHYICFGLYHFFLIITASFLEQTIHLFYEKTRINRDSDGWKLIRILKTTMFVIFGELIFRAHGMSAATTMIYKIFTDFSLVRLLQVTKMNLGFDSCDLFILIITCAIVLTVSIFSEKKISVRNWITSQNIFVRWAIYYSLILFIVVFGAYGVGYIPIDPIYAKF